MNARTSAIGISIADACQPFREKMDEYRRAFEKGRTDEAEELYSDAELIEKGFRAGVAFAVNGGRL